MKSTFNQSLVMLAIVDILLLVTVIIYFSIEHYTVMMAYLMPYLLYPIRGIFHCWEIYLTMSISAERVMAVYKPIHYRSHTVKTSTWIHMLTFILAPLLLSTAVNFPQIIEFEHSNITTITKDNVTITLIRYVETSLRQDPSYIYYYRHWTRLLLTGIVPFAFLLTTNTSIFLGMRRSHIRKNRRNNTSVRTLIAIVVLFLICNLPRVIISMVMTIITVDWCYVGPSADWLELLGRVNHLLLTTNSSLNFVIYICIGKRFKQILWEQMIGCYNKTTSSVNNIVAKQAGDVEMLTRTTGTLEEQSLV